MPCKQKEKENPHYTCFYILPEWPTCCSLSLRLGKCTDLCVLLLLLFIPPSPQNKLQIEGGGLNLAELCICEGFNKIHIFLVMCFMSHGALV